MNQTQDRAASPARLRTVLANAQLRGLYTGLIAVGAYLLAQRLFPHTRLLWAFAAVLSQIMATRGTQTATWAEELEARLHRATPAAPAQRAIPLTLNLMARLLLIHALIETIGMPWRGVLLAPIIGQTLLAAAQPRDARPRPWLSLLLASLLLLAALLACIGLAAIAWVAAALLLGFLLRRLRPNAPAAYVFWAENAEVLTLLLLATRAAAILL